MIAAAAIPGAAVRFRRFIRFVGGRLGSLGKPMHHSLMTATDGIRKLVVPGAGVFDAIERRWRLAPYPEIGVASAVEVGFMRAGRGAIPYNF